MPRTALLLLVVYLVLAFGLRSWLQWRATGSTGFRGVSGAPGSAEWWGGVLFAAALLALLLASVADLLGWLVRVPVLDVAPVRVLGLGAGLAGIAGTLWAQFAMGDAWRIGVDERERTRLVEDGPFRLVRNPIFTAMVVASAGLAALTPNLLAFAGLAALVVAVELQVRRVEEPYLLRTHGLRYRDYAARAGRFLPGIGRLPPDGE